MVMMELLTITVINFLLFCCNDGIVDRHCCKLSYSTNTTKQKKVYNSDGQQFHHYNSDGQQFHQYNKTNNQLIPQMIET
jgi:hypothetical protein